MLTCGRAQRRASARGGDQRRLHYCTRRASCSASVAIERTRYCCGKGETATKHQNFLLSACVFFPPSPHKIYMIIFGGNEAPHRPRSASVPRCERALPAVRLSVAPRASVRETRSHRGFFFMKNCWTIILTARSGLRCFRASSRGVAPRRPSARRWGRSEWARPPCEARTPSRRCRPAPTGP